jgi:DNA-binding NarL/FixJ family response regulator
VDESRFVAESKFMAIQRSRVEDTSLPDSPFSVSQWNELAAQLELTPQQAKIVDLILRGLKDKQIATVLKCSFSTVRSHLDRIFSRLDIADRVELILRVYTLHQKNKK